MPTEHADHIKHSHILSTRTGSLASLHEVPAGTPICTALSPRLSLKGDWSTRRKTSGSSTSRSLIPSSNRSTTRRMPRPQQTPTGFGRSASTRKSVFNLGAVCSDRFGETLQYEASENHFIYKYNYHDITLACSCKGRVWPWRWFGIITIYNTVYILVFALVTRGPFYQIGSEVYRLLGLVVTFLLVYRAKQAYTAYREVRAMWEDIISNCLEVHQMLCVNALNKDIVELAGEYLIALCICAKNYLRKENLQETKNELEVILDDECLQAVLKHQANDIPPDMKEFAPEDIQRVSLGSLPPTLRKVRTNEDTPESHVETDMSYCLNCLYAIRRIIVVMIEHEKYEEYSLGPHISRIIAPRLTRIHICIAQCHRIATTPMPLAYLLHLRLMLFVILLGLPFLFSMEHYDKDGKISLGPISTENGKPEPYHLYFLSFSIWFWCTATSYAFLGLEQLGNEMENPLGWDRSDLPLEHYIERVQYQIKRVWTITYSNYEGTNFDNGCSFSEHLRRIYRGPMLDDPEGSNDIRERNRNKKRRKYHKNYATERMEGILEEIRDGIQSLQQSPAEAGRARSGTEGSKKSNQE